MSDGTAFAIKIIERRGQVRLLRIRIGLRRFDISSDIDRQRSGRCIPRCIGNGVAKYVLEALVIFKGIYIRIVII